MERFQKLREIIEQTTTDDPMARVAALMILETIESFAADLHSVAESLKKLAENDDQRKSDGR